ncbi:MAG: molybdenum ABC transporter ATP-binding protein [Alphaproteobacteria bacterium]
MSGVEARFKGMFGGFSLDVAFSAPARGVTGLFGPSGCGKTTVLRCLAGLTRVAEGYLMADGAVWQDADRFLAPHQRAAGYVFQEPRLFSHLTVLGNLHYGLKRAKTHAIGLEPIIDLMGIRDLLARSTASLSGGERQRIAIGRALLSQPRLLLMDEPLSALDRQSRNEILPYLESLPAALSIPIIYVSHDLAEVERLADHLVLMAGGRVQAAGPLTELLTDLSLPLARLPEAGAVLDLIVEIYDAAYDVSQCRIDGLAFFVPGMLGPPGTRRRVRVRAGDVSLATQQPSGSSVLNILPARILSSETASPSQMLVLLGLAGTGGETRLLSSITRKSWDALGLHPGMTLFAQIKGMALTDR